MFFRERRLKRFNYSKGGDASCLKPHRVPICDLGWGSLAVQWHHPLQILLPSCSNSSGGNPHTLGWLKSKECDFYQEVKNRACRWSACIVVWTGSDEGTYKLKKEQTSWTLAASGVYLKANMFKIVLFFLQTWSFFCIAQKHNLPLIMVSWTVFFIIVLLLF